MKSKDGGDSIPGKGYIEFSCSFDSYGFGGKAVSARNGLVHLGGNSQTVANVHSRFLLVCHRSVELVLNH